MTDPTDREQTIAGLRELTDFLKANPGVPVDRYSVRVNFDPKGDDEDAERAEVDRIAAILGVRAHSTPGDHYVTEREFSGGVIYRAVMIPEAEMARWDAERSYAGAVQPAEVSS